jgi:hypothetical protein
MGGIMAKGKTLGELGVILPKKLKSLTVSDTKAIKKAVAKWKKSGRKPGMPALCCCCSSGN